VTKIPLNRREEKKSKDQQAASKQASKHGSLMILNTLVIST
jgi:hypothetical protein